MKSFVRTLCIVAAVELMLVAVSVPALAATGPVVTALSTHHGVYWGGSRVTVHGQNFIDVQKVMFGSETGYAIDVLSSTALTVFVPEHKYGTVHVQAVTSAGKSRTNSAGLFTFTPPTMNSPIMGGLTARQEQQESARVRAAHKGVHVAHHSSVWTAAMGVTAMRRAQSWLGLPYSWAGGNGSGPTLGVCAHNGGDLDCHVVGFDCSGLTLYAWSSYEALGHFAATQHNQAGRFHPAIGQLMPGDLVFFSGYVANGIGHVAVYEGGGMVVEAAGSGTQVMRSRLVDVIAGSGRYRGATRPMSSGRQGPGPLVSSVTAQVPVIGGYVTFTGSQLSTVTSVAIGGQLLYSFAKRTATRLVVKVPAHRAGTVTVAVSNAWGSAQRKLSYLAPPQLSSLAPSQGPVEGGTTVTITGHALTTVRKVTVGTTSVKFDIAASGRLTVTMPAHAPGSVAVTLYSRFGTSNHKLYTYSVPTPTPTPTPTGSTSPTASPAPPTTSSSTASSSPAVGTGSAGRH